MMSNFVLNFTHFCIKRNCSHQTNISINVVGSGIFFSKLFTCVFGVLNFLKSTGTVFNLPT